MKKITYLFLLFLFSLSGSYAQCIRTSQYGDIVSNNFGLPQTISNGVWTLEYSNVTGLTVGSNYVFTCKLGTTNKYITITDVSNTVIAHGPSPLTVIAITSAAVRAHWSDDAACAGTQSGHQTTVQLVLPCPLPLSAAVTTVTTTSADFTWVAGGSETAWEVLTLANGSPAPTSTTPGIPVASVPAYSATGLTSGTSYQFYYRANCGTEFSPWNGPINLTTACLPITYFSENFDFVTTPNLPACWTKIIRGATVSQNASVGSSNYPVMSSAPSNVILSNDNSGLSDDIILVSPNLSSLASANYRLKFYAKGYSGSLDIGTLNGSTNSATFTLLQNVPVTSTLTQYVVDFASYSGLNTYIGIRLHANSSYNSINIDDIVWEPTPTCPDVTGIFVPETTTTGATIQWAAGGTETAWDVAVGPMTTTDANTLTAVSATATTKVVTGLSENTMYKVWVRSVCTSGNGAWIGPITFTTACAPIAAFSENFDGVTTPNLPSCWSKIIRGTTLNQYAGIETVTYPPMSSSPNSVELYNGNAVAGDDIILVSPNLSTLTSQTYRLKFYAKGYEGGLDIGTLDGNTNSATFSNFQNVPVTNTLTQYVVNFNTYVGTDTYIGLRINASGGNSISIDNIVWELMPTCPDVTGIIVPENTPTSATIEWTPGGTETAWEVAVGPMSTTDPTTLTPVSATANTKTVTGLSENTTYKVWVRSVCTSGNGAWIGPKTFTTACSPITAFSENFDGVTTPNLPTCWSKIIRGTTLNQAVAYVETSDYPTISSAPNSVAFYNSNAVAADVIMLVSPNLSTLGLQTYRLKFYAKGSGSLDICTLASNTNSAVINDIIQNVPITNTPTQYVVDFSTYSGTDTYIGIRMIAGSYSYTNVDNIVWELSPLCPDVTDIAVSETTTATATINWSAGGTENSWEVAVGPSTTTNPTTLTAVSSAENTKVVTGLTDNTNYKVWVRSVCTVGGNGNWMGPISFTTQCIPTVVPYTENFETASTPALPGCTTVINLGPSPNQWVVEQSPGSGFESKTLRYAYSEYDAANTWFFTRGITLTQGVNYKISYRYGNNSTNPNWTPEKLKVMYGTSATADDMSTLIGDYPTINLGVAIQEEVDFTVPATGVYYFGFNAYSDANKYFLYVDDIIIDTALATNTFDISQFSYYPNPVKDVLNLSYGSDITAVAVYNILGQEVTAKSVNGTSAQVDMSALARGTYMVKVTSDNLVKTIKVIKE